MWRLLWALLLFFLLIILVDVAAGPTEPVTYGIVVGAVDFIERRHDLVTTLSTVAVAVFTMTLWIATDRLWKAGEAQRKHAEKVAAQQAHDMKASLALTRDTLTAQNMSQRAWLSYSGVQANPGSSANGQLLYVFQIIWKNTGQTPARKAECWSDGKELHSAPTETTFMRGPTSVGIGTPVVGPGITFNTPPIVFPPHVVSVRDRAFLHSRVTYQDIFSTEIRYTEVTMSVVSHPQPDGKVMFEYIFVGPQNGGD